jgi:transposase
MRENFGVEIRKFSAPGSSFLADFSYWMRARPSPVNLWTTIYDRLEQEHVPTILTNPKKAKAIAQAKIKTDKLDARMLADLLRGNLLSASYVPHREIRTQRSIIRERARLVQLRTIIKNRIRTLLDRYQLKAPCTDLFGKHGLE